MNGCADSDSRFIKLSSEPVTSQAGACMQGENEQVRQAETPSAP